MEIQFIIFIVIAALISAAVTFLIMRRCRHFTNQIEPQNVSSQDQITLLKQTYEEKLSIVNNRVKELSAQLSLAQDGKIDESIKSQLDGLHKLQKEVKHLKDEIDDLEDDVDDYKKKLKDKESEKEVLNTKLSNFQKKTGEYEVKLTDLQFEIKEKEKVLNLKDNSIAFVEALMNSKSCKQDSDTKSLYGKIDRVIDFIVDELLLFYKNNNIKKDSEIKALKGDLHRWAARKRKNWIGTNTSVAFVGEFSAGKTSIVNRLLSQDNPNAPLLPVSTKATTAIPTYIVGADNTDFRFVTPDDQLKEINESVFRRIDKETLDQVKGISSLIKYFVLQYKNSNLYNYNLLDTPGFNSNDKEDAERTIGVINECDALFWVFDVNVGTVNRGSLQLIKEHLQKPLFVIINKVDTKPASEVDKVQKLIEQSFANESVAVQKIIRFSSKFSLEDLMSCIHSVSHKKEDDNFISIILEELSVLEKEYQSKQRSSHKKYHVAESGLLDVQAKFIDVLCEMQSQCAEAVSIPKWETHFFGSDKYEMSEYDGDRLINILTDIHDEKIVGVEQLSNLQIEYAGNRHSTYTNYNDHLMLYNEVCGLKEKLHKYYSQLNNN